MTRSELELAAGLDVSPDPALDYQADQAVRDVVFARQTCVYPALGTIGSCSNVQNLGFCQFRSAMETAARHNMPIHAALVGAVAHVVGLGADKQMLGVDARRVVAVVADVVPRRDWTVKQFPKKAMCEDVSNTAISSGGSCSGPLDAFVHA